MGAKFSTETITNYVTGRKRKYDESLDDDDRLNKSIDLALHTPKKKKLLNTAKYIYQALFIEGKNSDVTVCALGEEFRLHRIYLCQCPYFASMFGGSWLETTQKVVTIDVIDPLISVDSLKLVLGSLYHCDIVLNPLEIVPILATATMFQLDGLIEKCTEVMFETINPKTAMDYYDAACHYGDKKLQEACLKWFLVNLMPYYAMNRLSELKIIPISLMTKLVAHPDLFVVQTEYSIYIMLKYWMYLMCHPEDCEPALSTVNDYFSSRTDKSSYLLSLEGRQFVSVFKGLRLQNLVSHTLDMKSLLRDNIIPKSWLDAVMANLYKAVLRVDQGEDKGPQNISNELFLASSFRCGRVINTKGRYVWRWTGFHFGLDLVMITDGLSLSVTRKTDRDLGQLLSHQKKRWIVIRVTVVQLNDQKQITYTNQSEIKILEMRNDCENLIMAFEKPLEYPIVISANILFTSPEDDNTENCNTETSRELISTRFAYQ